MKLVRDSDPVRMVYGDAGWEEAKGKVEGVVALIQPVSFFDAQSAEQAGTEKGDGEQVIALVRAGLVGFENTETTPSEFLKDPHPPVLLSLFNVVHSLTWGND